MIVLIFPQIIVIGILLQLKNPNYNKLLHLLNVAEIYYTFQNFITRYKRYIVLYTVPGKGPFLHELTIFYMN